MKLQEIVEFLGGNLKGDKEFDITGVAGITEAKKGDITFLASPKFNKNLKDTNATAVIVKEYIPDFNKPQISVKNPTYAFAKLLKHFYVIPHSYSGISKNASISETATICGNTTIYPFVYVSDNARIGCNCVIYPGVFIGQDSNIGDNCLIYQNVVIREKVTIGHNVIIHPGSVIGADGFGYVFEDSVHQKIPQVGGVVIKDNVEIGANVCIDRATTGNTIIGNGTKIDNLVQIGHNVKIGDNSIIISQVGIGGSSNIGDCVILAGQVGVADHATIEAGTTIGARGGVMPGEVKRGIYSGYPLMPHIDWLRSNVIFAMLPLLKKKIKEIEEKVNKLLEKGVDR